MKTFNYEVWTWRTLAADASDLSHVPISAARRAGGPVSLALPR